MVKSSATINRIHFFQAGFSAGIYNNETGSAVSEVSVKQCFTVNFDEGVRLCLQINGALLCPEECDSNAFQAIDCTV